MAAPRRALPTVAPAEAVVPYGVVSSLLAPLPATVVTSKKSTLATNRYMSTDMGIITGANERYKIRGANKCLRRAARTRPRTGPD